MPVSLRSKVKHLCHNGTLKEKERNRLLQGLESLEAWEKVKAEIIERINRGIGTSFEGGLYNALSIINKHLQDVKTNADSEK